jgi:peptidoglycan/LPS O-acetylase OafA/YrhL
VCLWQAIAPSRVLGSGPIQWLGDRSYSIYLLHPIVIELSKPLYAVLKVALPLSAGEFYWLCLLVTFFILFSLAEITYRLIEVPGMFLGSHASRFLNRGRQPSDNLRQALATR